MFLYDYGFNPRMRRLRAMRRLMTPPSRTCPIRMSSWKPSSIRSTSLSEKVTLPGRGDRTRAPDVTPDELADAIVKNDLEEVKKELGDVMLHLVFYAKIGSEQGAFDVTDSLNNLCEKLISRHPHIYGDVVADTEEQVKANWETLKLKEGNKSVLGGVPNSLPALVKAMRIQEKARGVGFDWDKKEQVWAKVEEELQEFKDEFNIAANENIDIPLDIFPFELKLLIQEKIIKLINYKFAEYLNLLYIIDVSEDQIKKLDGSDVFKLSEDVTFLILKREWQKVWFRNKY